VSEESEVEEGPREDYVILGRFAEADAIERKVVEGASD
jgi:hypothetical protein